MSFPPNIGSRAGRGVKAIKKLGGGGSSGLTVGTTAIASGTTTRVLYDNAGVLGERAEYITSVDSHFTVGAGALSFNVPAALSSAGEPLTISTTDNNAFNAVFSQLAPNLGSGNQVYATLGQANSTGNSAAFGYTWTGNNDNANVFLVTHYSKGVAARFFNTLGTALGNSGAGTTDQGAGTLNCAGLYVLGTNISATYAPIASPTFTGTVTIPTPYTIGAVSMTATGTQLNYLNAATGTTGTTSTNVVFSTSPTLITPALGTPSALVLTNATALPAAQVASGALVNGMTATTQAAADNSTKLATTAYVSAAKINTRSDYAAGTWTPTDTSGASLTFGVSSGVYVKIGELMFVSWSAAYPATASGAGAQIGPLPGTVIGNSLGTSNYPASSVSVALSASTNVGAFTQTNGTQLANSSLSTATWQGSCVFKVAD